MDQSSCERYCQKNADWKGNILWIKIKRSTRSSSMCFKRSSFHPCFFNVAGFHLCFFKRSSSFHICFLSLLNPFNGIFKLSGMLIGFLIYYGSIGIGFYRISHILWFVIWPLILSYFYHYCFLCLFMYLFNVFYFLYVRIIHWKDTKPWGRSKNCYRAFVRRKMETQLLLYVYTLSVPVIIIRTFSKPFPYLWPY